MCTNTATDTNATCVSVLGRTWLGITRTTPGFCTNFDQCSLEPREHGSLDHLLLIIYYLGFQKPKATGGRKRVQQPEQPVPVPKI